MMYILVLRASHNAFGLSQKKGDFSYEFAKTLFRKKSRCTLYGQNDRLYEDQSTEIFIVNTHWYCSIIHLKVSKKKSQRGDCPWANGNSKPVVLSLTCWSPNKWRI